MASTYPLEIVQAARWSKEHPEVKGDAVAKEMEKQAWDPSVKSLVAFPDVLTMMNEKLDWTQKLGDAFLAQQKDVMDAVQRLRTKAKDAGNLKSSKEQTVKTEPAPAGAPAPQIIIIESPSPEVVYVPTYNPTVVYGAWPYPAYPPYYYYPPAYVPGAAFFSFSMGVVVGGALWGNCNWGGSDVDIDVNRYNNSIATRSTATTDNTATVTTSATETTSATAPTTPASGSTMPSTGRAWAIAIRRPSRNMVAAPASRDCSRAKNFAVTPTRADSRFRARAPATSATSAATRSQRAMRGSQYRDLGGGQTAIWAAVRHAQSRDMGGSQTRDAAGSQNRDYGGSQSRDRSSSSSRSS